VNFVNITCKDRERILRDGTPAGWTELEAHAVSCAQCAEEFEAWKMLSTAAHELRDYSDSSADWKSIEAALAAQKPRYAEWWAGFAVWKSVQVSAAAGLLVVLLGFGAWLYVREPKPPQMANQSLLKGQALKEVERTEAAYLEAISKLAQETKGRPETDSTGLMSSYREKLMMLDSAIDDLREQAGQNPSNSHLRYQLLAVYQEKQRTLEEILEEKR
jgi:hypothetical protein